MRNGRSWRSACRRNPAVRARPKLPGGVSAGRDAPAGVDPPAQSSEEASRADVVPREPPLLPEADAGGARRGSRRRRRQGDLRAGAQVRQADCGHRADSYASWWTQVSSKSARSIERPATAGASIELTIDLRLQHIAENELAAAMQEYQAAGGSIIIMEPHTGEILAQASYPTFNPNDSGAHSGRGSRAIRRCRARTSRGRRSRSSRRQPR